MGVVETAALIDPLIRLPEPGKSAGHQEYTFFMIQPGLASEDAARLSVAPMMGWIRKVRIVMRNSNLGDVTDLVWARMRVQVLIYPPRPWSPQSFLASEDGGRS